MIEPEAKTQNIDEQKSAVLFISLPQSGGAIHGRSAKFSANPVIGTGAMSVPIATSLRRSGFGTQLSLSYDSSSSNGPFGFVGDVLCPQSHTRSTKPSPGILMLSIQISPSSQALKIWRRCIARMRMAIGWRTRQLTMVSIETRSTTGFLIPLAAS